MEKIKFNKFFIMAVMCIAMFGFVISTNAETVDIGSGVTINVGEGGVLNLFGQSGENGIVTGGQDALFGGTSNFDTLGVDDIYLNGTDGYINFSTTEGSSGYGIRNNSGTMQYKNSGGSWAVLGGSTPGDEGWLANAANNAMYPATNAGGTWYPIILGTNATSSPADADTELYIGGGGGLVVTGSLMASSTLGVTGAAKLYSTLAVTGNVTMAGTLAVTGTTALTGAVTTTGGLTVGTTLTQTGAATFASTAEFQGNASTTGSAQLKSATITSDTGAISFSNENLTTTGTLSVGAITTTGTLAVTGAVTVSTTLGVTGITTLGDAVTITGAATLSSDVAVDTNVFIVNATSNHVGIGTTTPGFPLSITSTDAVQAVVAYDVTNYGSLAVSSGGDLTIDATGSDVLMPDALSIGTSTASAYALDVYGDVRLGEVGNASAFTLDTGTGVAVFNDDSASGADFRVESNGEEYGFFVDASADRVGIGSSTPFATLSIDTNAGDNAFVIGSSTATYLTVDTAGNLTVDTNTLLVDAVNNRVGIGSTTPSSALSIGANMTSTSTVMAGRLCLIAAQENGTVVYLRLGANQPANQPFATSTVPCN